MYNVKKIEKKLNFLLLCIYSKQIRFTSTTFITMKFNNITNVYDNVPKDVTQCEFHVRVFFKNRTHDICAIVKSDEDKHVTLDCDEKTTYADMMESDSVQSLLNDFGIHMYIMEGMIDLCRADCGLTMNTKPSVAVYCPENNHVAQVFLGIELSDLYTIKLFKPTVPCASVMVYQWDDEDQTYYAPSGERDGSYTIYQCKPSDAEHSLTIPIKGNLRYIALKNSMYAKVISHCNFHYEM